MTVEADQHRPDRPARGDVTLEPAPTVTADAAQRQLHVVLREGWDGVVPERRIPLDTEPAPTVTTRCTMGGHGNYWIEPRPGRGRRANGQGALFDAGPRTVPAPDRFDIVDPDHLDTDHRCPCCGYEWSGGHQ